MFTGIVESIGTVTAVAGDDAGRTLTLEAPEVAGGLAEGSSIAVDGVCLTVVGNDGRRFAVQVVPETLRRTSLGRLAPGERVNLERALAAGGRLDGHVVQGHVDGLGTVTSVVAEGEGKRVGVAVEEGLLRYIVEKGSVALDGVSLTVAALTAGGFEVALIPHTLAVTTLGLRSPGDPVNLEVDILAKYVERLLEAHR
jgi:riboflavin synthase